MFSWVVELKNFRENFCYLNYLEQGQNQLLHTRIDERKDALGNLFNITDITAEINNRGGPTCLNN